MRFILLAQLSSSGGCTIIFIVLTKSNRTQIIAFLNKGIKPEWEDDMNKDGGKWVVTLPIQEDLKEEDAEKLTISTSWTQIILMMIGVNIDTELYEIINGAVFSIRDKHRRISVWISDNLNKTTPTLLKKIGIEIRNVTKLPVKYELQYQVHKKAIQHNLDNEAFLTA